MQEVRWFHLKELMAFEKTSPLVSAIKQVVTSAIEAIGSLDDFDPEDVFQELKRRSLAATLVPANNAKMEHKFGNIFSI